MENLLGEENRGFMCIPSFCSFAVDSDFFAFLFFFKKALDIMYNFNHERMGIIVQANRFARVCYEEAFRYPPFLVNDLAL